MLGKNGGQFVAFGAEIKVSLFIVIRAKIGGPPPYRKALKESDSSGGINRRCDDQGGDFLIKSQASFPRLRNRRRTKSPVVLKALTENSIASSVHASGV